MSLKLYIEAVSPADIRRHVPPSHQQAIRDIVHLPDDQYAAYISGAASIPLNSWVRVKWGWYRNDIAYVLCEDDTSVDVLIVPRERPYNEIEGEDVPGVTAGNKGSGSFSIRSSPKMQVMKYFLSDARTVFFDARIRTIIADSSDVHLPKAPSRASRYLILIKSPFTLKHRSIPI